MSISSQEILSIRGDPGLSQWLYITGLTIARPKTTPGQNTTCPVFAATARAVTTGTRKLSCQVATREVLKQYRDRRRLSRPGPHRVESDGRHDTITIEHHVSTRHVILQRDSRCQVGRYVRYSASPTHTQYLLLKESDIRKACSHSDDVWQQCIHPLLSRYAIQIFLYYITIVCCRF